MKPNITAIRAQAKEATRGCGKLCNDIPWIAVLERTEMEVEELPNITESQKVDLLLAARNVAGLCDEVERLERLTRERDDWERRAELAASQYRRRNGEAQQLLAERDEALAALSDKSMLLERYAVMRDQRDEARTVARRLHRYENDSHDLKDDDFRAATEAVARWDADGKAGGS